MNPKRPTLRHIIIKIPRLNTKGILKTAREKQLVTYKEAKKKFFRTEGLGTKYSKC